MIYSVSMPVVASTRIFVEAESMIYSVSMPVVASTRIFVEAESEEAAYVAAAEFEGMSLPICWHCGNTIDYPAVGEVDGIDSVSLVDDDELDEAMNWIRENGGH